MNKDKHYYLFKIQYLGYRFHGWQKQPKVKTLHLMIDRTFNYILEGKYFKTLAAGRTDAMVSANEAAFELFLHHKIEDETEFLNLFNKNLPQDIRALSIKEVSEDFNIINSSKTKEYIYLFTYGEKCHPFCAPFLTTILVELDIELMIRGAKLFEGKHNFKAYCYRISNKGLYNRTIDVCELIENNQIKANFFPEKSYMLRVMGKGFGRNQIRIMMGTLIKLGRGEVTLEDIKNSLLPESTAVMDYIAPASGLILNKIEFEE
ncbi:MAG: tRNA pseudouridine(38-40) synthase TruA [Flavobacteriaceae bacterium]